MTLLVPDLEGVHGDLDVVSRADGAGRIGRGAAAVSRLVVQALPAGRGAEAGASGAGRLQVALDDGIGGILVAGQRQEIPAHPNIWLPATWPGVGRQGAQGRRDVIAGRAAEL